MKILSLDGGGVFGKAQAIILTDSNCSDKFDAFAGTSIGAVQAAAASLGYQSLIRPQFFDKWMPLIFNRSWLRVITTPFTSKYLDDGLNESMKTVFGNALFGDAKKPLFVTAIDLSNQT